MSFPVVQKYFNVFDENSAFLQQAKAFTPPKFARKMEDYQGGPMDGTIAIDMGAEKLESEITFVGRIINPDLGSSTIDGVYRRVASSYQNDKTGAVDAVEWEMRGRIIDDDNGSVERGKLNEEKEKLSLNYYCKRVNNRVEIEIDVLNMVYRVRNRAGELVDIMAAHRAALQ